ncbi:MAG: Alpha-L-fucosidase [bacterium ADurb.Bin478]|nr:MAG: Alpha-L-fucosidase [bacterium ADurb.Bin478]
MSISMLSAVLLLGLAAACKSEPITQDQRMEWWRRSRFGLFIHWGLYAIPAGIWKGRSIPGIGEWIMYSAKIPVKEYRKLAEQFNPQKFDAKAWVGLAKAAGMKYITITSKHHDGFALYGSKASSYNIVDATPFKRDPIKELAEECRRQGLKMCFYYSQVQDWNEPGGYGNTWDFPVQGDFQKYLDEKVKPQLTELLTQYGPVGMIWFDTPYNISAEQAQSLKDLVRRLQPACIISGRLGGGVKTDYISTGDNVVPGSMIATDWEVPATLNDTWGFKVEDHAWKSPRLLTIILFDIVAKGGNYLLNVGPTAEGVIPAESAAILHKMGEWMSVNGECIYGTEASPFQREFGWGNITRKGDKLFLGFYQWPADEFYLEGLLTRVEKAWLLADPDQKGLAFQQTLHSDTERPRLTLHLPSTAPDEAVSVVVLQLAGEPMVQQGLFQSGDGSVLLPGVLGKISRNGEEAQLNFGSRTGGSDGWLDPAIAIDWDFHLEKPGRYRVDIITMETGQHGDPAWVGGHTFEIHSTAGLQGVIRADEKEYSPRAHYWHRIHTHAGHLTFDRPGSQHLRLQPLSINPEQWPDGRPGFTFKEIILTPAD